MKNRPLSQQFAEKLKQLIASGVYKVGGPLPSVERLHIQNGISKNTIIASLKSLREEGIIQKGSAPRQGYMIVKKPDDLQELPNSSENNIVKINMPFSFWNSVGNKLLEALEAVFTTHAFRLIFSNNNNSTQEETRFLQTIPPEPISKALILMTGSSFANPNAKLLNHLHSRLPVIFLDRYIPNVLSHYVGVDNHDIGFQATRYLIQKGHKRIGFANHSSQLSTCHDRCGGYLAALMQFGLPLDHQIVIYRSTDRVNLEHIKSLGQKLGEEILALEDMPTAWVCASDKEAVGLIDFFLKQGYVVPDDMVFIGCDNDEFLLYDKDYTLTTFEYPYSEIAHEIYQLAGALTAHPTLPYKKIMFAAKFVQGDTA